MEILIIFLALACAILTIGMIYMQEELNNQKNRAREWKTKFLTEMEEEEFKKKELIRDCATLENKVKKTLKEVEEYKAKYSEILKQNQELLLKIEQSKPVAESVEEKPKAKVTATRKPRKKKRRE